MCGFICGFYLTFMFCMTGPLGTNVCCECYEDYDYNEGGSIDLRDFAVYQREYSGG